MQTKEKVLRKFNRVIISSQNTGAIEQLDSALVNTVVEKMGGRIELSDILIVSFVDHCHWMLVTLNAVYWSNAEGLHQLEINELKGAKLDLLTNKKIGFDSRVGFNIITLQTNKNAIVNVKIEGGSALEATMALINELIVSGDAA